MEKVENWKSYDYFGDLAKNAYFGMTRGSRKIRSETLSPKTISNDSYTYSDHKSAYRNGKS